MPVLTIVVLVAVAAAGWLVVGLVRWSHSLPKTQDGWAAGAQRQDAAYRAVVPEVAADYGMLELARRAATFEGEWFPAAEFLMEMPSPVQRRVMRVVRKRAQAARRGSAR